MGGDSASTPHERVSGAVAMGEHKAQQGKEQEQHDEQEWVDVDSDDEDTVCTKVVYVGCHNC